jgi:hypothetical protein
MMQAPQSISEELAFVKNLVVGILFLKLVMEVVKWAFDSDVHGEMNVNTRFISSDSGGIQVPDRVSDVNDRRHSE